MQAAWVHSAPHHGYARAMKVGKEEAIGMLMAVEMWTRRDHKAEWSRWLSWLDDIAKQVTKIDGVTTSVTETTELSNRTPSLAIKWDPKKLGITGAALAKHLMDTEPRIATPGGRDREGESSISITPYQMAAGDEKIVAERIHATLSNPPASAGCAATAAGGGARRRPERPVGRAHRVPRERVQPHAAPEADGRPHRRHASGGLRRRAISPARSTAAACSSRAPIPSATAIHLSFRFTGTVTGDTMAGTLDMGEYLAAKWTAKRHDYRRG